MSVAFTNLTNGTDTDSTSTATTASVTLTASRLHLLTVASIEFSGSPSNVPTCSGWTQVGTFVYYDGGGTNVPSARLTVLRRMPGSNVTGTHVIDFGTGTPAEVLWSIDQSDANVDTGGTNGSAAIVQTAQGTGATAALLATLAAFGSADNGTFGAGVIYASGMSAWTVGTGFTALDNYAGNFATDTSLLTEYRVDNDTTVDATASTTGNWGMLGIEIKAAAGGGGGTALDDTGWHPAVEPQTNPLTVSVW